MMHVVKKLLSGDFARNVSVMLAGIIIGQVISVGSLMILSRLYTVGDIGVLSLFLNVQMLMAVLSVLTYDTAIMLPKSEDEAKSMFRLCLRGNVVTSSFVLLGVVLVFLFLPSASLGVWIFAIPLSMLIFGFLSPTWVYCQRRKDFRLVATNKILQSFAIAAFQISLYCFGAAGLVWGYVLGILASLVLLYIRKSELRAIWVGFFSWDLKTSQALAVKYKQFPLFAAPSALVNTLSGLLPELLLASFFGLEIVALFAFGKRMIHLPVGMVVSALTQVFYQKSNVIFQEKPQELLYFCRKIYKTNLIFGILPALSLFFSAPFLFEFIFGSSWRPAGEFTRYLLPWIFMVLLNSPLEVVSDVLGKQKQQLRLILNLLFLRVVSICIGYYFWNSAHISILLFGAVGFGYQCFMSWYLFKIIRAIK